MDTNTQKLSRPTPTPNRLSTTNVQTGTSASGPIPIVSGSNGSINLSKSKKSHAKNTLVDLLPSNQGIKELSRRLTSICQINECQKSAQDLADLCQVEGNDMFDKMKHMVENHDVTKLKHDIDNIMTYFPVHPESNRSNESNKVSTDRLMMLLILRMFRKIKKIEAGSQDYYTDADKYYKYQKMYQANTKHALLVHEFNTRLEAPGTPAPRPDNHASDYTELLVNALTCHKMNQELLTYELLYYKPKKKIQFTDNNLHPVAEMILSEFNRFNSIITRYTEDHQWTINYTTTMNFVVPDTKIIISNTILTEHENNDMLLNHLDIMVRYLENKFDTPSIKYYIIEDNKYYMSWILVSIGYRKTKKIEY
jgi:hypothetical protein